MDISKFRTQKTDDLDKDAWSRWLVDEPGAGQGAKPSPGASRDSRSVESGYRVPNSNSRQKPQGNDSQTVSINIRMPSINKDRARVLWRRIWPWLLGAVLVAALLYGGKLGMEYLSSRKQVDTSTLPTNIQAAIKLGYKPIMPDTSNRVAGSVMPSELVPYPEQGVYSFTDQYNGARITVDQQALPDKFKTDPRAILDLADKINATDNFSTSLGTVYMYTSEASGAQRLVLANDKMLMFLQSTTKLATPDWVTYIQSLK